MKAFWIWLLMGTLVLGASFEAMELIDKQQPITGGYRNVKISPMRELTVADPVRVVGSVFPNSLKETNFWVETVSNGGVVTGVVGEIELRTATNANSSCMLQSVRTARYVAGAALFFRANLKITSVTVSNQISLGPYDATSGGGFMVSNLIFSVFTRKTGVDTLVPSTSFNGYVPTMSTNACVVEIWWTDQKWYYYLNDVRLHTSDFPNEPACEAGGKKITIENKSYGGGTNALSFCLRSASIYSFGQTRTECIVVHLSGAVSRTCKLSGGRLHRIIVNSPGTLCTIYDDTSAVAANIIGIIDINKTTGGVGTYEYDCPFFNGLTVVTTGGGDVTVVYE